MRKVLLLMIVGFVMPYFCYAQKQGNVWIFGNEAGIDFNGTMPMVYLNSVINSNEKNASIAPTNVIETNRKSVNEIYINTWANNIFEFDPLQISALTEIANQKPIEGGDAVYSARVLLNLEIHDELTGSSKMEIRGLDSGEDIIERTRSFYGIGKIYPNPLKDEATIDYQLEDNQIGIVEIYNVIGKRIAAYNLNASQNHLVINTAGVESGIYICKAVVNGKAVYADKLVIIK